MSGLPAGVHEKHGRYYWVYRNKWHALSRVEQGEIALLECYYELTRNDPHTMAGVLIAYMKEGVPELAKATQPDYRRIIVTRLIPYCGHMLRNTMRPGHVAQYLEGRKNAGAAVSANRERAVLSSACNFAMRRGWLDFNPCHGVKRNKERPASRYVEHGELVSTLDRAPLAVYHILAGAYLTGARQTELRNLTKLDLGAHGIRFRESKTGKERTVEWSPTLRQIVSAACARSSGQYVFTSPRGLPWSEWGLQSAMRRLQAGFRFRDLRAKAASDVGHNVLQHSPGMLAVYQRRKRAKPVK